MLLKLNKIVKTLYQIQLIRLGEVVKEKRTHFYFRYDRITLLHVNPYHWSKTLTWVVLLYSTYSPRRWVLCSMCTISTFQFLNQINFIKTHMKIIKIILDSALMLNIIDLSSLRKCLVHFTVLTIFYTKTLVEKASFYLNILPLK